MKLNNVLPNALALFTAVSAAAVHSHRAPEEKRDVTVVVTNLINQDGQVMVEDTAAQATQELTTLEPVTDTGFGKSVETTTQAATDAYTPEPQSAYQSSSSTSSSSVSGASASSSSSSDSSSDTQSSGNGEYGGALGITYSPYTNSGSCKSEESIKSDISKLSQFNVIRLYDTDCNAMEIVASQLQGNQKVFLGIYYIDKIDSSVSAIQSAFNGDFSKVYAVSVGNELVNSGASSASQVASAVQSAKSQLSGIGYNGDVVTVDTLVATQNNPELCGASDFIAVNCHPFWDGHVQPSDCGPWVKQQLDNLGSTCNNGKKILVTETGWPTQGSSFGSCVPSKSNQEACIQSIVETIGSETILFTTYNDYWKHGGDYGVEQFWGIFGDSSD